MMSYNRQNGRRTRKQALALLQARKGNLYQDGARLVLREPGKPEIPVRAFGTSTLRSCIGLGWLMKIPRDGMEHVITTIAGDAELRRPFVDPNRRRADYYRREREREELR